MTSHGSDNRTVLKQYQRRTDDALSPHPSPQALLANIASLYAVYHGPEGLRAIAARVNGLAAVLAEGAKKLRHGVPAKPFFDTVAITVGDAAKVGGGAMGGGSNGTRMAPAA